MSAPEQQAVNAVDVFRFQRYQQLLQAIRSISVELSLDPGILTAAPTEEAASQKIGFFTAEVGKLVGVLGNITIEKGDEDARNNHGSAS